METKLCPNCKNSVNAEYNVCPSCGTALTNVNEQNNSVAFQQSPVGTVTQGTVQQETVTSGAVTTLKKTKIKKPILIAIISFVAVAIAVVIILIVKNNALSDIEKKALGYAKQIQNGLKSPNSFELYGDDIVYIKMTRDDGTSTEYFYFDYTANNSYGTSIRQQDVFIDGKQYDLNYVAPTERSEYNSDEEWQAALMDNLETSVAQLALTLTKDDGDNIRQIISAKKIQARL